MATIQVQVRNVYGTPTIYPMCENAKRFATIAKTKTLSQANLRDIAALGFSIEHVPEYPAALRLGSN